MKSILEGSFPLPKIENNKIFWNGRECVISHPKKCKKILETINSHISKTTNTEVYKLLRVGAKIQLKAKKLQDEIFFKIIEPVKLGKIISGTVMCVKNIKKFFNFH